MLRVHKKVYKKDVPLEPGTLAKDFRTERGETSEAVKLAKAKNQLRKLDPEAYEQLYGKERGERSPTSILLELEAMKMIRAMRNENNGAGVSTGNDELKTEVRDLKKQLQDQKYATLTDSIKELKEEIRANKSQGTSDLAVVISAAEKTASKFLEKANVLDMGMSLMGFQKVPITGAAMQPPTKMPPAARKGIIERLREKGLVTTIRQT